MAPGFKSGLKAHGELDKHVLWGYGHGYSVEELVWNWNVSRDVIETILADYGIRTRSKQHG